MRLHRRIATAFESRDLPPAVLAMHWRLVPGWEAGERTLRYARAAGDAAMLDLDPAAAATWYETALAVTEDPATRRELLTTAVDARDRAESRELSRRSRSLTAEPSRTRLEPQCLSASVPQCLRELRMPAPRAGRRQATAAVPMERRTPLPTTGRCRSDCVGREHTAADEGSGLRWRARCRRRSRAPRPR